MFLTLARMHAPVCFSGKEAAPQAWCNISNTCAFERSSSRTTCSRRWGCPSLRRLFNGEAETGWFACLQTCNFYFPVIQEKVASSRTSNPSSETLERNNTCASSSASAIRKKTPHSQATSRPAVTLLCCAMPQFEMGLTTQECKKKC